MREETVRPSPLRFFFIGAAHIDRRGKPAEALRLAASNPGVLEARPGGAVHNAALALHGLCAERTLLSARGGDADGDSIGLALAAAGILDLSVTWLDRATPTYTAILDQDGELVVGLADMELYDRVTPRLLSRRHVRAAMQSADALMLDANLPSQTIASLAETFAGRTIGALGVSPAKALRLADHLSGLSAVFLSRAEAAGIVGTADDADCQTLARLLSDKGARRAVVTDGPREAAVLDSGAIWLQQPPSVAHVRDVTGAGDTLGALATYALAAGVGMVDAARFGMAGAGRLITGAGIPDAATLRTDAASLSSPRRVFPR